jgi:hypothetical protein
MALEQEFLDNGNEVSLVETSLIVSFSILVVLTFAFILNALRSMYYEQKKMQTLETTIAVEMNISKADVAVSTIWNKEMPNVNMSVSPLLSHNILKKGAEGLISYLESCDNCHQECQLYFLQRIFKKCDTDGMCWMCWNCKGVNNSLPGSLTNALASELREKLLTVAQDSCDGNPVDIICRAPQKEDMDELNKQKAVVDQLQELENLIKEIHSEAPVDNQNPDDGIYGDINLDREDNEVLNGMVILKIRSASVVETPHPASDFRGSVVVVETKVPESAAVTGSEQKNDHETEVGESEIAPTPFDPTNEDFY